MQKWMSGSAWGSTGYLCDDRYGVLPKIGKKVQFYPKYYFIFCAFVFTDFWALCNNPTTHIARFWYSFWKDEKYERERKSCIVPLVEEKKMVNFFIYHLLTFGVIGDDVSRHIRVTALVSFLIHKTAGILL